VWLRGVTGFPAKVNEAVGATGPLENHIWSLLLMPCEEAPVKGAAFILRYTCNHFNACLPHTGDALSCHQGIRIGDTYNHPANPASDYQVCTGRSATVVRAGLQADVH